VLLFQSASRIDGPAGPQLRRGRRSQSPHYLLRRLRNRRKRALRGQAGAGRPDPGRRGPAVAGRPRHRRAALPADQHLRPHYRPDCRLLRHLGPLRASAPAAARRSKSRCSRP
jgi:hypothetical protein